MEDGEEYFRDLIENEYVIVCEDTEKIVGYLAGSIDISCSYITSKRAELYNMFILEEYRSQGIGKKFISEFIEYCNNNHVNDIGVTASFKNVDAIKFYMKNGFQEFELTLRKKDN